LLLELSRSRAARLIVFADEVYDKVVYDGVEHTALGSLSEDVLTVTFNGLSKKLPLVRLPRGLDVVGPRRRQPPARERLSEGLGMLASMRLRNVPGSSRSRPRSAATRASTS
jgi:alanine-synthesizing transaminase